MKLYIAFFAILFTGCPSNPHYKPVNWDSEPTPPTQFPPERPKLENDPIQRLLDLHNEQRGLKGRPNFTIDSELNQYAQQWANNMARRNKLYHSDVGNILALNRFYTAGENIAWNQQTPEEVVNAWMHSEGHRENIMNRQFTKIGFGFANDTAGEIYWCTVFGG